MTLSFLTCLIAVEALDHLCDKVKMMVIRHSLNDRCSVTMHVIVLQTCFYHPSSLL